MTVDFVIKVASVGIGISVDVLLCWLSWRFLIKPKLTRFIDSRIAAHFSRAE